MNSKEWKDKYRTIVVEGPIGVGKTSLVKKLASKFQLTTVLEKAADNPFLEKFYIDNDKYALPTQLFFLFQRLEQLTDLTQGDLFERNIISDFMIEKDLIFAGLTLSEEELSLYKKIYDHQSGQVSHPDLVIFLKADPGILMTRVKKRGIEMEREISLEYLSKLCIAYNKFFYSYDWAPVLVVNTSAFNPVHNEEHFEILLNQIQQFKGRRAFYNAI